MTLTKTDLEKVRQVVREELDRLLRPEPLPDKSALPDIQPGQIFINPETGELEQYEEAKPAPDLSDSLE